MLQELLAEGGCARMRAQHRLGSVRGMAGTGAAFICHSCIMPGEIKEPSITGTTRQAENKGRTAGVGVSLFLRGRAAGPGPRGTPTMGMQTVAGALGAETSSAGEWEESGGSLCLCPLVPCGEAFSDVCPVC